jgi:hypothetical protein
MVSESEKQFLVFGGIDYYAGGGWYDLHSVHETAEDAIKTAKQLVIEQTSDWSHVVDISARKKIKSFRQGMGLPAPFEVYEFDTEIESDGKGGFTNGTLVHSAPREA